MESNLTIDLRWRPVVLASGLVAFIVAIGVLVLWNIRAPLRFDTYMLKTFAGRPDMLAERLSDARRDTWWGRRSKRGVARGPHPLASARCASGDGISRDGGAALGLPFAWRTESVPLDDIMVVVSVRRTVSPRTSEGGCQRFATVAGA